MPVKINSSRTVNKPTIRQRRKQADIQRNLQKLLKENRKKALLKAKNGRLPLKQIKGVGRDSAPAAGGSGSGGGVSGSFISTDGIFTLVIS